MEIAMREVLKYFAKFDLEDAEPVIHCKDCVKRDRFDCPLAYIENKTLIFINRGEDWYCADGEREENEI